MPWGHVGAPLVGAQSVGPNRPRGWAGTRPAPTSRLSGWLLVRGRVADTLAYRPLALSVLGFNGLRVSDLSIRNRHEQQPVLLDPMERYVLPIALGIRIRIFLKPLRKRLLHRAPVSITKVEVSQIVSVVKKQVPNFHVVQQLLSACILVILILVDPTVKCGFNLISC